MPPPTIEGAPITPSSAQDSRSFTPFRAMAPPGSQSRRSTSMPSRGTPAPASDRSNAFDGVFDDTPIQGPRFFEERITASNPSSAPAGATPSNSPAQQPADSAQQTQPTSEAANSADDGRIEIQLRSGDGNGAVYRVTQRTQMRKLMQNFADRVGRNVDTMRFRVDGVPVLPADTVASLELQNGDFIDIYSEQIGGGAMQLDLQRHFSRIVYCDPQHSKTCDTSLCMCDGTMQAKRPRSKGSSQIHEALGSKDGSTAKRSGHCIRTERWLAPVRDNHDGADVRV